MKRHQIEAVVLIFLAILSLTVTALRDNIFYLGGYAVVLLAWIAWNIEDAGVDNENF